MKVKNYMQDGAGHQARAVLAFLSQEPQVEESWNEILRDYDCSFEVGRWENCREQGYVVYANNKNRKQLNIAFFEHRNSDSICAVKWVQSSINSLTIDTAKFGDVYKDKYDISHSVGYGQALKMADWIREKFVEFWLTD